MKRIHAPVLATWVLIVLAAPVAIAADPAPEPASPDPADLASPDPDEPAAAESDEPAAAESEEPEPAEPARRPARFPSEAPLGWAQAGRDLEYVYTRPAHLDRRGWAKVGWTLGSVAALYLVREEVAEGIRRNHNQDVEDVLTTVRNLMGKVGSVGAVSVGYLWTGAARDSDYDKETAQILAESVLYALPIAGIGMRVVATQRPFKGDDIGFIEGEGHSISADVTVAASMLAPIIDRHLQPDGDDSARRIFWKRFGTWSLYSLAGLVAVQRMYTDRHYLPDVVLGYANGLTIGRLIVDNHRGGREWRDRRRRVRIEPGAGGVRIVWGPGVAHE